MKELKFTKNKNFMLNNLYVRVGKGMDEWEREFTKEQSGCKYEEDIQAYNRLLDYDRKYHTDYAEYFAHFHFLWYYDNNITKWSCELRNRRDKDIFIAQNKESIDTTEDIRPLNNRDIMAEEKGPLVYRKYKSSYSESDYQPNYLYSNNWEDILINKIDSEK